MRMICTVLNPTSGEIFYNGANINDMGVKYRDILGYLPQNFGYYPDFSAHEFLLYMASLKGIQGRTARHRVDELLQTVGLSDVSRQKIRSFSGGMKQRLGIAITLLNNPEFLILDEPINGLDPLGVVEIRKLLIKLCDEKNMTILISSHNLPEMYQLATDYIFINKGEIIETLTLEELDEHCKHYLLLQSTDVCKLVNVIERKLNTTNFKVMPDNSVQLFDYIDDKELVGKTLFENEVAITNLSNEGGTLEDYFVSMVGGGIDNV